MHQLAWAITCSDTCTRRRLQRSGNGKLQGTKSASWALPIWRNDGPGGPSLFEARCYRGRVLIVVTLFGLEHHLRHATALQGASYFANDIHREETHPLLLFGIESVVERLPGIGEPFQVGAALSQGLSTSAHEFDRIKLALTGLFCQ